MRCEWQRWPDTLTGSPEGLDGSLQAEQVERVSHLQQLKVILGRGGEGGGEREGERGREEGRGRGREGGRRGEGGGEREETLGYQQCPAEQCSCVTIEMAFSMWPSILASENVVTY